MTWKKQWKEIVFRVETKSRIVNRIQENRSNANLVDKNNFWHSVLLEFRFSRIQFSLALFSPMLFFVVDFLTRHSDTIG